MLSRIKELRTEQNLSLRDLASQLGIAYTSLGKYERNEQQPSFETLEKIADYARFLSETGADGAIISDAGVIACVKKAAPALEIHLSTQANVTNSYAARFWADNGVKRIVLARETSLENIKRMRDALLPETELEAFVHGAMCVAYSGRCLLSAATTGRS